MAGDESLRHFVMSCREETRRKEERETSDCCWNFGNARGPKSFYCSGRRKDVSVSAIKGSSESFGVARKIQSRPPRRDKIIARAAALPKSSPFRDIFQFPRLSIFSLYVSRLADHACRDSQARCFSVRVNRPFRSSDQSSLIRFSSLSPTLQLPILNAVLNIPDTDNSNFNSTMERSTMRCSLKDRCFGREAKINICGNSQHRF